MNGIQVGDSAIAQAEAFLGESWWAPYMVTPAGSCSQLDPSAVYRGLPPMSTRFHHSRELTSPHAPSTSCVGIPYAEPPVGPLRFAPARKIALVDPAREVNATAYGAPWYGRCCRGQPPQLPTAPLSSAQLRCTPEH